MISNKETKVDIEEIPERRIFKVTFTKVDELDSEDLLKNLEQIRQAAKQQEEELSTIDLQVEKRKEETTRIMNQNLSMAETLSSVELKAKVWKKLEEAENARKSKQTTEGEESKSFEEFTN